MSKPVLWYDRMGARRFSRWLKDNGRAKLCSTCFKLLPLNAKQRRKIKRTHFTNVYTSLA